MGRSSTTKYAVEMQGTTSRCWYVKNKYGRSDGPPTPENLARYVQAYIDSLKPNGANYHISKALGYMPIPNWARIVLNGGNRPAVAEWKAPAFCLV